MIEIFRRNLLKTASMEVGQVSYHDKTKVKRMRVEKDNAIVNNLNRTKEVRSSRKKSSIITILIFCRCIFYGVSYFIAYCFRLRLQERYPDLAALQEERAAEFRLANKIEKRTQMQVEKTQKRERDEQAKIRNYS
jgi:hypothetical protein